MRGSIKPSSLYTITDGGKQHSGPYYDLRPENNSFQLAYDVTPPPGDRTTRVTSMALTSLLGG